MGGSDALTDADRALVEAAREARDRSYAPVSKYRVGAALRAADGSVHRAANVENIVLAETCCAEKNALYRAISDGHRRFGDIAIVTDDDPPAGPCGSCRQILAHWRVPRVILSNLDGDVRVFAVDDLLPIQFALPDPAE